jgi:hypothetical protein
MRLNESEVLDRFRAMARQCSPLIPLSIVTEPRASAGTIPDATIEFKVDDGPSFRAMVEVVSPASPQNVRMKSIQVLDLIAKMSDPHLVPLIIAPYVGAKQSDALLRAGVSWIDLSGNMIVRVADRLYIERTGRPNLFPDTAPIKRVFQGTASLVARALLLEPNGFTSLFEIASFIRARGGSIAVSTVSKVLASLEEELLISRDGSRVRTADAASLLDRLAERSSSSGNKRTAGTCRFAIGDTDRTLRDFCSALGTAYVFCGFYAARLKGLAASDQIVLYVTNMGRVMDTVSRFASHIVPDDQFGQLCVIETRECIPWFNAQIINGFNVVDDMELYIELMNDTPRGPEIAETLRSRILGGIARG